MKHEACFYKVLIHDDYASKLRLPPVFMDKFGELLGSKATLRTDLSRKSWIVKLRKIGDLHHFLGNGWSEFAQDFDLQLGDFVLFKFVGSSTLNVTCYDMTGCEKELADSGNEDVQTGSTEQGNMTLSTWVRSCTFSKELKQHHFTSGRLEFPKYFAVDTGIAGNRNVELENGEGRRWPVTVTNRPSGRFCFSGGWVPFLRANGHMVVGRSTLVFEFVPGSGNVIRVRVTGE